MNQQLNNSTVLGNQPASMIVLQVALPKRLAFLLEMHRYKVIYGGRGGGKSWAVADALLTLGSAQPLRILCAREIQKSIAQSVHQLLVDRIKALGFDNFYTITDKEILGANGTSITFAGLSDQTATSIKSFEGIDIVWVEEAQTVSKRSWKILIPTIRVKNSEIWVTFNPDMDTDDTYVRFVSDPKNHVIDDDDISDMVVVEHNWNHNPWWHTHCQVLEKERRKEQRKAEHTKNSEDYDNIWEGKPRTALEGAIYAREMHEMAASGRIRPMPYDPRFQVHFIWDLGWNDAMSIVMVQKPAPSAVSVIDYIEDSFQRYDEFVERIKRRRYRMGWNWLPHDSVNGNPITGTSAIITLRRLGMRCKPPMERTGPNYRIKSARMMFPRVYIDNTEKECETGFEGGARLIECLKRYRRNVPKNTEEANQPKHDEFSHGADAFGALAEVVDQIVDDEFAVTGPKLETFQNSDPGMGLL